MSNSLILSLSHLSLALSAMPVFYQNPHNVNVAPKVWGLFFSLSYSLNSTGVGGGGCTCVSGLGSILLLQIIRFLAIQVLPIVSEDHGHWGSGILFIWFCFFFPLKHYVLGLWILTPSWSLLWAVSEMAMNWTIVSSSNDTYTHRKMGQE